MCGRMSRKRQRWWMTIWKLTAFTKPEQVGRVDWAEGPIPSWGYWQLIVAGRRKPVFPECITTGR